MFKLQFPYQPNHGIIKAIIYQLVRTNLGKVAIKENHRIEITQAWTNRRCQTGQKNMWTRPATPASQASPQRSQLGPQVNHKNPGRSCSFGCRLRSPVNHHDLANKLRIKKYSVLFFAVKSHPRKGLRNKKTSSCSMYHL